MGYWFYIGPRNWALRSFKSISAGGVTQNPTARKIRPRHQPPNRLSHHAVEFCHSACFYHTLLRIISTYFAIHVEGGDLAFLKSLPPSSPNYSHLPVLPSLSGEWKEPHHFRCSQVAVLVLRRAPPPPGRHRPRRIARDPATSAATATSFIAARRLGLGRL